MLRPFRSIGVGKEPNKERSVASGQDTEKQPATVQRAHTITDDPTERKHRHSVEGTWGPGSSSNEPQGGSRGLAALDNRDVAQGEDLCPHARRSRVGFRKRTTLTG